VYFYQITRRYIPKSRFHSCGGWEPHNKLFIDMCQVWISQRVCEDGDSRFFRNLGACLPNYTMSHPTRQNSSPLYQYLGWKRRKNVCTRKCSLLFCFVTSQDVIVFNIDTREKISRISNMAAASRLRAFVNSFHGECRPLKWTDSVTIFY
jgi:hypothetical protein